MAKLKKVADLSNLTKGYEGIGEFYDLFADNSDIPFYIHYANKTGSPILDLAAGTGRVSFSLAEQGFDVTALEKSPSMLSMARRKMKEAPQKISKCITLIKGDMENFKLPQRFSLIIIPYSFGHALTKEAQLNVLRCVHEHLREEGLFILDLYVGELQYTHASFEDAPVPLTNGRTVERHGEIHSSHKKRIMQVNLKYIIKNKNRSIIKEIDVVSGAALIYKDEFDTLVQKAGLLIVNEFGNFDESPYNEESGRRILILQKSI